MQQFDLSRRLAAEAIGTAGLLAVVVGSGIMGESLAGGNVAIALLGNTIATGAILVVLILAFGPLSGAHFNPAVTLAFLMRREITPGVALLYVLAQIAGGLAGALAAHAMFELPLIQISETARSGPAQWFAEWVATFLRNMTMELSAITLASGKDNCHDLARGDLRALTPEASAITGVPMLKTGEVYDPSDVALSV